MIIWDLELIKQLTYEHKGVTHFFYMEFLQVPFTSCLHKPISTIFHFYIYVTF